MTTDLATPPPATSTKLPWWTPGDTNAFFGLGFNILVNVLTLTGLMIFVVADAGRRRARHRATRRSASP